MKRFFALGVFGLVAGALVSFASFEVGAGTAHADTPALLDAGPGSATAAAPLLPSTLPDPTTDPADFMTALKAAKTHGWPLAILVGAVGLLELAAYAGKKKSIAWLAWLGKGRTSIVIGGGIAILTAGVAALSHAGTWSAAFIAMGFATTTYWHQAGTDPAKG